MFEETIQLRVRYHDCDAMGIVYHGHYAKFFEIGRTEAMRKHGFAYKLIRGKRLRYACGRNATSNI
jgi:acyl-CoA thioester hydrolase